MEEKRCFKCGKVKALSEFYSHPEMGDGHLNKCKDCAKADVSLNYRAHRNHYASYERQRNQRPERKEARLEHQKVRRSNNPDKYHAYCLVSYAVRSGKLTKQPCEVCGEFDVEAHHEDYSKPLEVEWLCRAHHLQRHGKKAYQATKPQPETYRRGVQMSIF